MGWAVADFDHTFKSSGRTVRLRQCPNAYVVFERPELTPYLDQFLAGEIEDPEAAFIVAREIARAQMVRPRIAEEDEELPAEQDPEDPEVVPYRALFAVEADELLEMWKESAANAGRFRGERDGTEAGGGGEDVGDAPKPARRTPARKRARRAA